MNDGHWSSEGRAFLNEGSGEEAVFVESVGNSGHHRRDRLWLFSFGHGFFIRLRHRARGSKMDSRVAVEALDLDFAMDTASL